MNLVDVLEGAFQAVVRHSGGRGKPRPKTAADEADTLMGTTLSLILTV